MSVKMKSTLADIFASGTLSLELKGRNAGNRTTVRNNIDRSNNRDLDGLSKNIYNRDGNVAKRAIVSA